MELKREILFDIDPTHYSLSGDEAVIVWCFDDRFNTVGHSMLDAIVKSRNWVHRDMVTEPGGAKLLSSENVDEAQEKQSLLNRIKSGIVLHHARTVILSTHIDCGAYGYSKSFPAGTEEERLISDLVHAEQFLKGEIPADISIESYSLKMDGPYRVRL